MSNYKIYYVYILASKANGVLYTGVTDDLMRRIYEHKKSFFIKSFTSRYKIFRLVYYEVHNNMHEAFDREKCIKKWYRQWKVNLIEKLNHEWKDLSIDFNIEN